VISLAPGTKVYLASKPVSMRLGFDGLAALVRPLFGDCQEFCAGGRLPSLDDEALTEDYGELTFGLTPFARWALPFVRRVIEHEI